MNIWKRLISKKSQGQPLPGPGDKLSLEEAEQLIISHPGAKEEIMKYVARSTLKPTISQAPDKPTGLSFDEIKKLFAEEKARQNRIKKIQALRSQR